MRKKPFMYICLILGILIVLTWILIGRRTLLIHDYQQQAQSYQQRTSSLSANIASEKLAVKKLANAKSLNKDSRQWIEAEDKATQTSGNLFSILLTFNSSKQYSQRKTLAKKYLDDASLKNPQLFGSDDDGSGGHYIDLSGLSAKYDTSTISAGSISENKMPVVIKASLTSNNGVSEDLYTADYDYANDKFLNLVKLTNLTQTTSSGSSR